MQREKICKGYYRFGSIKLRDAVIYLLGYYAYARDGVVYKQVNDNKVPEGYVRVSFRNGNWYQSEFKNHTPYEAPKKEEFTLAYTPLHSNQLTFFENKARELMNLHGLHKWKFVWDNSRRRAGVCCYSKKEIGLSKPIAEKRDVFMTIDTILHEIAHALTPGHHHNKVWRAKAIEIGCDGKRCYDDHTPENKWMGVCPNGHTSSRSRKPDGHSCGKCSTKFDKRYIITWTENVNKF
ncbi:MAG: SprT-like domain-containing protein [Gloeobacteraceae cyanobacterium ES-bin-316]|nr:SprT-like domain-containing protein [Ferruginibacter sp.]